MTEPTAPRAVLWDLDGTLADSTQLHWQAWRELMESLGRPLTYEQFTATFGLTNRDIVPRFLGREATDAEIRQIGGAKEQRYRDLVNQGIVWPMPGVLDWLKRLQGAGWKQAVGTSAPRANVSTLLSAMGLAPWFDAIVSADDVTHGKPDPEIFLKAAARLGVPPERCVVVEDAPAGIEAARRGGMRSIACQAWHPDLAGDLSAVTLDQLPEDAFDRLVPVDR